MLSTFCAAFFLTRRGGLFASAAYAAAICFRSLSRFPDALAMQGLQPRAVHGLPKVPLARRQPRHDRVPQESP